MHIENCLTCNHTNNANISNCLTCALPFYLQLDWKGCRTDCYNY